MDYYLAKVFYLPQKIPEDIIWSDDLAENLFEGIIPNKGEIALLLSELSKIQKTKQKFTFVSDFVQGESSANAISSIHRQFIRRWLYIENKDFQSIKDSVTSIIDSYNQK